jgi:hypothetical protein
MAGTVWSKFFWADWLSDAGLRACSATARGVWMDMLCVAAAHDPPGYVAFSQTGLTEIEIARLTGETIEVVRKSLAELERNKAFGRTRQGIIYSRRMVRDHKRKEISRKNGQLGGNPNLRKDKGKSAADNPNDNGGVTPNGARARASISHKPIANSQSPDAYASKMRGSNGLFHDWPADYRERFLEVYPHRVGIKAALAALDKLAAHPTVSFEFMIADIKNYAATKPPERQFLNPKTYIEQERWNDKPATAAGNGHHRPSRGDRARELARQVDARERESAAGGEAEAVGGAEPGGDDAGLVSGDGET